MSATVSRCLRALILLGPILAGISPTVHAAPGEPNGRDWVGPNAAIYLEVPEPGVLLDRLMDPKTRSMLDGIPQYRKFLGSPDYQKAMAGVDFISTLLDTTWEKGLRDLAGGGIVLAIEATSPPRMTLVVTPKDPAFLAKAHGKLVAFARADAAGKGKPDPIKAADYRGIKSFALSPEEAHAIVDGSLIVANSGDALKAAIDRKLDRKGSIAADPTWKARKAEAAKDPLAWGYLRMDRLRKADPMRYNVPDMVNPGATFFFAPWIEAYRKADWVSMNLAWTAGTISARLSMPTPAKGYPDAVKRYVPGKGQGAAAPLNPPGTVATLSLWRDLSSIWEVRTELFPPQVVQGFAQLDTVAGQFFGGRDFGTGVLGALQSDWRIVVARQDFAKMNPVPDVKLPAFALVVDLKPDDDEFAQRLRVAYQSFIGLANLGAAQSKSPPLELGSETFEGVTISTSKYMPAKADGKKPADAEPVHQRHNFSPSVAQVGNHFVLSSSLGLAKGLVTALKAPAGKPTSQTVVVKADGGEVAGLLRENRDRLVMQNMLEKGNDKEKAESEVDVLIGLLGYLGKGELSATDMDKALTFALDFTLSAK